MAAVVDAVRRYEPGDREAVVERLPVDGERFDWLCVESPFAPEPPVVVAEDDGAVVGVHAAVPFPLRAGRDTVPALLQLPPVVAPGHRDAGLPARMVERVEQRRVGGEPQVGLAFGDVVPPPADRDVRMRAAVPAVARVQDPGAVARAATDGGAAPALGWLAAPAVSGYLSLQDRLSRGADLAVERVGVPDPARLAALAAGREPAAAHAHRSAAFYRWRFAEPGVEHRSYVAHGDWGPVAALVVGRRPAGPVDVATVVEVTPVDAGDRRPGAVAALLDAALSDAEDADVVTAPGSALPRGPLADRGFRSAAGLLPSRVARERTLRAYPLGDAPSDAWLVGGVRLSAPDRWRFAGCECGLARA